MIIKLKIGDKVHLPKTKKYIGSNSLSESNIYKRAIKNKQNYLYVTDIKKSRITLSEDEKDIGTTGGDYFDLVLDNITLFDNETLLTTIL